jgi:hypothetical protein
MAFDPYQEWLNLPGGGPRTHYELLGLAAFEEDPLRIQQAAMERTALVRRYQLGPHAGDAIRLLGELAAAFDQLHDPLRKQAYDDQLRGESLWPVSPAKAFDPYHEWLNLPEDRSATTYYDLLGLAAFEENSTRIREAAIERAALVRRHQSGPHGAAAAKLLAELAAAYSQLGHPEGKRTYDAELRRKIVPSVRVNRLGVNLGVAAVRRGRPESALVLSGDAELPASGSQFFRLDELREPPGRGVVIRILAGQSPSAEANAEVGRIKLLGVPPEADGNVLVHVTIAVATHDEAFATAIEMEKGRTGHTRLRLPASAATEGQRDTPFAARRRSHG